MSTGSSTAKGKGCRWISEPENLLVARPRMAKFHPAPRYLNKLLKRFVIHDFSTSRRRQFRMRRRLILAAPVATPLVCPRTLL